MSEGGLLLTECWAQKKKGEKVVFLQQIFQSDHSSLVLISTFWKSWTVHSSGQNCGNVWDLDLASDGRNLQKFFVSFFLKCTHTHTITGFQWSLDSCRRSPPKSNRLLAYHPLWYFCNKRCLIILWCGSFHKTLPWSISKSCYWLISFFSLALGYLHRI